MSKSHFGYTLIELLITIAIIGILALVAVPIYQNYVGNSSGASAMGGLTPYVLTSQTCVKHDSGCQSISGNILMTPELSSTAIPAFRTASNLSFDDGDCIATVTISARGELQYSARSSGAGATDEQCREIAGLN